MPRIIDLTGLTFGKYTVLRYAATRRKPGGGTYVVWLCRCECGTEKEVSGGSLKAGTSRQCASCARRAVNLARTYRPHRTHKGKSNDLTGQTFGKWLVLGRLDDGPRHGRTRPMWKCRCRCSAIGRVTSYALRRGKSKGCVRCAARERGDARKGRTRREQ